MSDAVNLLKTDTQKPLSARADEQVAPDQRTLGRDMLGALTIFLIVVTYHIQNAGLQFETQFGSAFRNASLQTFLVFLLTICVIVLIGKWRDVRTNPLKLGASIALILYTLYMLIAIIARVNLMGALLGMDQEVFYSRLNSESPREMLATHAGITGVFEWLAIVATLILWQPWTRLNLYKQAIAKQTAPLIVAVIVLVLWEAVIEIFKIQQFLLPRPTVIGVTFLDTYPRLISAGWNTFQNAFLGFLLGCGAGIFTGMFAARFASFSRALMPIAIAINAIPIIALAPIMNNWFGALNPFSKIAMVAVLVYFPAMISTVKGLTSVEPLSLELMKSYAATPLEIFRKLRFPSALPYIFSALKVATTLSMIAAIVSEYFGGSTAGLGYKIRDDAGLFRYPEAWATIVMASLFGIIFYVAVSAVERALMSWHVSFREK